MPRDPEQRSTSSGAAHTDAANCPLCGQPMLPPGGEKRLDEYDHAEGCPDAKRFPPHWERTPSGLWCVKCPSRPRKRHGKTTTQSIDPGAWVYWVDRYNGHALCAKHAADLGVAPPKESGRG